MKTWNYTRVVKKCLFLILVILAELIHAEDVVVLHTKTALGNNCLVLHEYSFSKNRQNWWKAKITNECREEIDSVRFCAILETTSGLYDSCRRIPGYSGISDSIGYVIEGVPVENAMYNNTHLIPGQSLNLTVPASKTCIQNYYSNATTSIETPEGRKYCPATRGGRPIFVEKPKSVKIWAYFCKSRVIVRSRFCIIGLPHKRKWCLFGYHEDKERISPLMKITRMSKNGTPVTLSCVDPAVRDSSLLPSVGDYLGGW